MMNIAVIVGSLLKESFNLQLAKALEKLSAGKVKFSFVNIANFPLYNQDTEEDLPQSVAIAKDIITKSDGILFVTPEYNRSIPGVLKNAIDWVSRPWGKNTWDKKPAGLVGISVSPVGTAAAQAHLRDVLSILGVRLYCKPEVYLQFNPSFFTPTGEIADPSTEQFLRSYLENLCLWIEKAKD